MEKKKVKILTWYELEDKYSGEFAVIGNDNVFNTEEFKEFIREELGYLVDIENELEEELLEDFDNAVNLLSQGKDASYLDYAIQYTEKDMLI